MSHLVSVWFLCIPSLISVTKSPQVVLNQSIIVYWGGLNQGIFIDEACYWALIIGDCGPLYATDSNHFIHRVISNKRAQPNTITFIQYTRSVTGALIDAHRLFQFVLDSRLLLRHCVRALRSKLISCIFITNIVVVKRQD